MAIFGNQDETIVHKDNGEIVIIDNETNEILEVL